MNKQQITLKIMNDNATKSRAEVLPLLAEALNTPITKAAGYYTWGMRQGAAGTLVVKQPKEKKTKEPKITVVKVPTPRMPVDKPKIVDKTVEEINDAKAKNLARMEAISKKYLKGQYAEGRSGSTHTAAEATEIVSKMEQELDSFKQPKFLTSKEVKAMV